MVKTCLMDKKDLVRLNELKQKTESASDSQVIREAIREYHKKIFGETRPVGSNQPIQPPN